MGNYKRLLLIINPNAGMRKKENSLNEIIMTFSEYDYETIVCFTKASGDGTRLVEEHAGEDIDLIVCMGGDGTLNEVFGGARKIGWEKPIGYIPAGSTNDFANSLGLPFEPVEAAKNIMTGSAKYLDLGEYNKRSFVYTACCGIFTKTSYETPQKRKNMLGHFAYLLEGMKDITQVHPIYMEIELEKEVLKDNFIFVAICNTFSLGGIMTLDEMDVDLADGEFELLAITQPRDIAQLNSIIVSLYEQNFDNPLIAFRKISKAEIRMQQPEDWSLDGERGEGKEKNRFRVIQNAVKMIY